MVDVLIEFGPLWATIGFFVALGLLVWIATAIRDKRLRPKFEAKHQDERDRVSFENKVQWEVDRLNTLSMYRCNIGPVLAGTIRVPATLSGVSVGQAFTHAQHHDRAIRPIRHLSLV